MIAGVEEVHKGLLDVVHHSHGDLARYGSGHDYHVNAARCIRRDVEAYHLAECRCICTCQLQDSQLRHQGPAVAAATAAAAAARDCWDASTP